MISIGMHSLVLLCANLLLCAEAFQIADETITRGNACTPLDMEVCQKKPDLQGCKVNCCHNCERVKFYVPDRLPKQNGTMILFLHGWGSNNTWAVEQNRFLMDNAIDKYNVLLAAPMSRTNAWGTSYWHSRTTWGMDCDHGSLEPNMEFYGKIHENCFHIWERLTGQFKDRPFRTEEHEQEKSFLESIVKMTKAKYGIQNVFLWGEAAGAEMAYDLACDHGSQMDLSGIMLRDFTTSGWRDSRLPEHVSSGCPWAEQQPVNAWFFTSENDYLQPSWVSKKGFEKFLDWQHGDSTCMKNKVGTVKFFEGHSEDDTEVFECGSSTNKITLTVGGPKSGHFWDFSSRFLPHMFQWLEEAQKSHDARKALKADTGNKLRLISVRPHESA